MAGQNYSVSNIGNRSVVLMSVWLQDVKHIDVSIRRLTQPCTTLTYALLRSDLLLITTVFHNFNVIYTLRSLCCE